MLHSNKTSKPVMTVHTSQKKIYLLLQSCLSLSIKLAMLPLYPLQPLQNGLVNQSITIVQKHVISLYINIKIATQKWHHKSNKTVSKYHTFFPPKPQFIPAIKVVLRRGDHRVETHKEDTQKN